MFFFFLNNQPRNVGKTEAYLSHHPTIPNHRHRCSAGTLDLEANIPSSSNVQRAPNCTGMLICCVTTGTEPQLCPCQPKHLHCDMKRSPKGVSPNFLSCGSASDTQLFVPICTTIHPSIHLFSIITCCGRCLTDLTNCCLQDLCLLLLFGDQAVSVLAATKSHSVNHSDTSAHHKKINNTSAMFAHTSEGTIVCAKPRRPRLTRQSASCAIITHCCCRCLLLAGCLRWATERVFGGHRWTMVKGGGGEERGWRFWIWAHSAENGSCAETADKEGESVLVRAGVQPVRLGMA